VLVAGGAYLFARDTATPASVDDAVFRFRADGSPDGTDSRPTNGPKPGVYRYSIRGAERIDALLDSRHDYDHPSTVTVSRDGCSLIERSDLLEERWTRWEFCLSPNRRRLRALTEFHQFFGVSVRERYRCSGASVPRAAALRPGFDWTDRCSGRDASVTLRGRVVGIEKLTVAGKRVDTVHLRFTARPRGRISGSRTVDSWLLRSNGLLARRSEKSDIRISGLPTGSARSRERYTMRLRSLKPLG